MLIKYLGLFCLLFSQPAFWSCRQEVIETPPLPFDSLPVSKPVDPRLREASGLADSRRHPGSLWVQEDSGNPPVLHRLGHDGSLQQRVFLSGITNRDWEDLALSDNQLYLADIGDNGRVYPDYTIYRFEEPAADTVTGIEAIRFRYPDGSHDAEAFLVAPDTKDIYIITKSDKPSRIYKLAYPYSGNGLHTLSLVGNLDYTGVVSAAQSADGRELMVKTYFQLFYYTRPQGTTVAAALSKKAVQLPYQQEPQGEAVAFAAAGNGFYTLSEKSFFNRVDLFFYKRK